MNYKKGQAAMEFLMTYGWAILVVLAAIGALAYFGVLSPGNLLPDKTTFKAPFIATENAVITESGNGITIQIPFTNGQGDSININTNSEMTGDDDCTGGITLASTVTNPIANGHEFILTWNCTTAAQTSGDKFSADLGFTYNTTTSGLNRIHSGTVLAKVQ